jgi:peroxiredoxin
MLPLGTAAPDFRLPDVNGKMAGLADFKSAPALVVLFICNHCPYVKHIRAGLAEFGRDAQKRGVAVVAINANDPEEHPEDGPGKMKQEAQDAGYTFPYLFDKSQAVAKAYRRLAYRGQFDDRRPGKNVPVTGRDLRAALELVLAGKPGPAKQTASIGCNIKWKPGNEPDYFGG